VSLFLVLQLAEGFKKFDLFVLFNSYTRVGDRNYKLLLGHFKVALDGNGARLCKFDGIIHQIDDDLPQSSLIQVSWIWHHFPKLHKELEPFLLNGLLENVLNLIEQFFDYDVLAIHLLELVIFQSVAILHVEYQIEEQFALVLDTLAVFRSISDALYNFI